MLEGGGGLAGIVDWYDGCPVVCAIGGGGGSGYCLILALHFAAGVSPRRCCAIYARQRAVSVLWLLRCCYYDAAVLLLQR